MKTCKKKLFSKEDNVRLGGTTRVAVFLNYCPKKTIFKKLKQTKLVENHLASFDEKIYSSPKTLRYNSASRPTIRVLNNVISICLN